ncbi:SdpI family protein [Fluviispira multicolorata]|uniref:SdpI/YhfL protein family protein n=1 Tax=Fluviispira multicolorata TaxID=2654512 RepID=A0A833N0B8_9BACT|nr:hypothetical protein GCL57_11995 [Fluviispira multicolorata]
MKIEIYLDNIVYFFSYIIIGLIFYTIRNCEPNNYCGYRTKISFESKKNWKILNLYCCKYSLIMLHIFNLLNIINAILKYFLDVNSQNENIILLSTILLSSSLLIGFLIVILYMKKIEKRIKK